jgi:hypothetical protein
MATAAPIPPDFLFRKSPRIPIFRLSDESDSGLNLSGFGKGEWPLCNQFFTHPRI